MKIENFKLRKLMKKELYQKRIELYKKILQKKEKLLYYVSEPHID